MINNACLMALIAVLSACVSNKNALEITTNVRLLSTANPSEKGVASPMTVVLYQLADKTAFLNEGYRTIFEGETLLTGQTERREVHLSPGEAKIFKWKIEDQTKFIAGAAGYQQFELKAWKTLLPLPEKKKHRQLIVVITEHGINLDVVR